MSDNDVDHARRRFLTTAVTVVGGTGVAMSAVPFVASLEPSERTKAIGAPVEADIGGLQPRKMMTVKWQGKPVWIVRRSKEDLEGLAAERDELRDPDSAESLQPPYAHNEQRSIKPEYFVVLGVCTHLGCSPTYRPDIAPPDLGPTWRGGFYCPCHGSRFDLAGRVVRGVPAPTNLEVPKHRYLGETRLVIGSDEESPA